MPSTWAAGTDPPWSSSGASERALARIPTWLFSSGPVGAGTATARPGRLPQPEDVAALAGEIGAHATTFGGRVDPDDGGFDLQIMASAGLAGDWRDFHRIRAWARAIAADVLARTAAAGGGEALDDARLFGAGEGGRRLIQGGLARPARGEATRPPTGAPARETTT